MSGSQKTLKIISIVMIVWAVITVVIGALLAAGSALPDLAQDTIDVSGTTLNAASAVLTAGLIVVVNGVLNFIVGCFGLRGAKNPKKIGVFFVLCIINLVLGVLGIVLNIVNGSFQWTSLISLAIVIVCTYLAVAIKKQA